MSGEFYCCFGWWDCEMKGGWLCGGWESYWIVLLKGGGVDVRVRVRVNLNWLFGVLSVIFLSWIWFFCVYVYWMFGGECCCDWRK